MQVMQLKQETRLIDFSVMLEEDDMGEAMLAGG